MVANQPRCCWVSRTVESNVPLKAVLDFWHVQSAYWCPPPPSRPPPTWLTPQALRGWLWLSHTFYHMHATVGSKLRGRPALAVAWAYGDVHGVVSDVVVLRHMPVAVAR